MRDRPGLRQQPAVVAVAEEQQADRGQDPAGGAPTRLEQQEQQDGAHHQIRRRQQALPVEERVVAAATAADPDRQDGVETGRDRQDDQNPVGHGGPRRRECRGRSRLSLSLGGLGVVGASSPGAQAGRQPQVGRVGEEDQREYAGQEDDQVVLAALRQGAEHLPQGESADRQRRRGEEQTRRPGEHPARFLVLELGGQVPSRPLGHARPVRLGSGWPARVVPRSARSARPRPARSGRACLRRADARRRVRRALSARLPVVVGVARRRGSLRAHQRESWLVGQVTANHRAS